VPRARSSAASAVNKLAVTKAEAAAEPAPPPREEVLLEEIRDLLAKR